MFGCLLFIVVYLPFQLALSPSEGIDLASGRVLIGILFLVWLAESLKKKKLEIKPKVATGFFIVFLFLSAFSIIFSQRLDWSVRKIIFLFSIAPIYFIGQSLINTNEKKEKIIKGLIYSAFFAALIGLAQFLAQFIFGREKIYQFWADYVAVPFLGKSFSQAVLLNPSWLVNIAGETYLRATAFFPDPHMLSFFLGMILPLSLGWFLLKKEKPLFNLVVLLTILVTNFLTFSRGGYLGILVGIIFLGVIFFRKISRRYQIGLIFITLGIVVLGSLPTPVNKRFQSIFNLKEGSNQGRIVTWKKALTVIEKQPFFGVGIGNYPLEIKASADYREPIYAHNTYLDIAVETGIPSVLAWLGFLFFAIRGLYKNKNPLLFFASVSVIIFATHSLVETGIYSVTVLPIFLIIASLNNE